jgi:hypothetical protein
MSGRSNLIEGLQRLLVKLRTLRDSCRGIVSQRRYPDFSWFEGAAAICQEAIEWIREVILRLKKCKE